MVKLTMIARVTDGLPLVEGLDDGRDVPDADFYKKQAKAIFANLSRGLNDPSRMSIETGPYMFQYLFYFSVCTFTCYCSLPILEFPPSCATSVLICWISQSIFSEFIVP